jgi:WD40 repeat protein
MPVITSINEQNALLVISSLTGKPIDQFAPIPLGTYYNYAFSPDKKTLAVVSSGQLHLIDLLSWNYRVSDIDLHGPINSVVYSPDGTLLALAGGVPARDLRVVDAQRGALKASAQADFSIRNIKFTANGKAIMIYGPQLATTGVAANAGVSVGAPRVALYAVADLSLLWSSQLKGIRDGTFPKKAGTGNTQDIYQPGAAWHYEPGIAFDPNRDLLYLVHGDEDKLTTVDFSSKKVKTVDVHAQTSWLDQLLALTVDVAYAKGMDGTIKQAVISPDGKFLYVAGNTEAVTQPENDNNWNIIDTPTGLQVIAAEDGALMEKISIGTSSVRLSPNSKQLFLTGWNNGTPRTEVYDISSRRIIKRLEGVYLIPTRRLDGKAILVSIFTNSSNVSDTTLMEPDTWATISEWNDTDNIGWLIAQ